MRAEQIIFPTSLTDLNEAGKMIGLAQHNHLFARRLVLSGHKIIVVFGLFGTQNAPAAGESGGGVA